MNPDDFNAYGWLCAATVAALLQVLLLRTLESRAALRRHLVLAVLCVLALAAGAALHQLALPKAATLAVAMATLIMGVLLIRLLGLVLFRMLLPAIGTPAPRILEDIVLVMMYLGWGMVELRYAGLDLGSLVTTSAVITGIIAFSMQETLGNILGGLALQLDNSVRIGDWIRVDDIRGKVIEVHWRYTAVRTNNGDVVVIPNSTLMKSKVDVFSTSEHTNFRRWVYFPVSYPVPPATVIAAVEKAIGEADIAYVAATPAPQCVVMDYKDGSTIYALRYWLTDPLHDDSTDSMVRIHIYTALQRDGHELARPCVDAHLTSDSAERNAEAQASELARRLQALNRVDLFKSLSDAERKQMALSLHHAPFTHGAVMTRQGAVAHWLYLLVQGEAEVWYEVAGKERQHLTTLPAGSVFGEMGLMTGEPRRATVTARTDALCYRLDKENFEKILHARPELADECARILTERNQLLIAVEEHTSKPTLQEQHATILAGIRKFFGLV